MTTRVDILLEAKDKASKQIEKATGSAEKSFKDLEKTAKKANKSIEDQLKSVGKEFLKVTGGVVAVGAGMKKVYDIARGGAALDFASAKFDRLAVSMNDTSILMRGKLADATQGLMSDAESVALAGEIMSLGLVKTSDQAVRLARIVSNLGADMNQVTLTLANQTTMRFDQIGIAVEGFDDKVQRLVESGMTAEDAFNEAFLQQGEEQIEKVGSVADETYGKFLKLEAGAKDLKDAFSELFVGEGENINFFADVLHNASIGLENLLGNGIRADKVIGSMFAYWKEQANPAKIALDDYTSSMEQLAIKGRAVAEANEEIVTSQESITEKIEAANRSILNQVSAWQKDIEWMQGAGGAAEEVIEKAWADLAAGAITLEQAQKRVKVASIDAIEAMAEVENLTLDQIQTQFENLGYDIDLARRLALSVYSAITSIDGLTASADIFINTHGNIPQIKGNQFATQKEGSMVTQTDTPIMQAKGGKLQDFAVVGEKGFEVVWNGYVFPHEASKHLLSAMGENSVQKFATGGLLLDGEQKVTSNTMLAQDAPSIYSLTSSTQPKKPKKAPGDMPPDLSRRSSAQAEDRAQGAATVQFAQMVAGEIKAGAALQVARTDEMIRILKTQPTRDEIATDFKAAVAEVNAQ